MRQPDKTSLRKRYFYKLLTNITGAGISIVTQAIVPRCLGPKAYGDFNYLSSFFTQFSGFFDMGTSVCFYTRLSQRPNEKGLVDFYLFVTIAISCLTLILVVVAHATSSYSKLWPNQELIYIYYGAFGGILTWNASILNQMADAYGITVMSEIAKIVQRLLGLVALLLIAAFLLLDLQKYFYYTFASSLLLGGAFIFIIKEQGYYFNRKWMLTTKETADYMKEFYRYSSPFFASALVILVCRVLE
ncbi:MAG: oligosaccharide flippase family protein, partial [Nitrospirae bacterium]|nr:oligosaccharide flippase family protein [Nitrospirota bacterium]